jgi:anthranilate/para-aminobenzoate synthase component I
VSVSLPEQCILGPAFGDLAGTLSRVDVDDGAPASAILAAVDRLRGGLADDERILFMLGYEACAALDPRAQVRGHDPTLGPASLVRRLQLGAAPTMPSPPLAPSVTVTTTTAARQAHLDRIARCREALLDGVIYQANLAHRLHVAPTSRQDALAFFAARRHAAACAAFIDVAGWGSLVSLSPERFVAADFAERQAWTWPIKGTVRRGGDAAADAAALATLQASTKDQAEHVMIVDLLRNDLGRVAVVGGVAVTSLMHVVSTTSVHHLESTVSARLRDDVDVGALLRASVPGGSITGAPKTAAVDVIASLEDGPRGAYTGVLGVVDGRGRLMTSLLIRTWLRPDTGPGALHVGGGIVVDSDAEAEWQETLHKAAAFGNVSVVDND